MKLFVFQDVLSDYTGGQALIVAEDFEQAAGFAHEFFGEDAIERDREGWKAAVAVYDVADDTEAGVREFVFGGC